MPGVPGQGAVSGLWRANGRISQVMTDRAVGLEMRSSASAGGRAGRISTAGDG